jgi:hypothetical protein
VFVTILGLAVLLAAAAPVGALRLRAHALRVARASHDEEHERRILHAERAQIAHDSVPVTTRAITVVGEFAPGAVVAV